MTTESTQMVVVECFLAFKINGLWFILCSTHQGLNLEATPKENEFVIVIGIELCVLFVRT